MIAVKAKTKVRILTSHSDEGNQMNQSEHTQKNASRQGGLENACQRVAMVWYYYADWLRMWRDITTANPKAEHCRNKVTVVTVSMESKTAPQDELSMINKKFTCWVSKAANCSHTWEKVFAPNENNISQRIVRAVLIIQDLFTFIPFLFDWRRPKVWTYRK